MMRPWPGYVNLRELCLVGWGCWYLPLWRLTEQIYAKVAQCVRVLGGAALKRVPMLLLLVLVRRKRQTKGNGNALQLFPKIFPSNICILQQDFLFRPSERTPRGQCQLIHIQKLSERQAKALTFYSLGASHKILLVEVFGSQKAFVVAGFRCAHLWGHQPCRGLTPSYTFVAS